MSGGTALLEVKNLKKYYPVKSKLSRKLLGQVKAVDGISFSIQPGLWENQAAENQLPGARFCVWRMQPQVRYGLRGRKYCPWIKGC